MKMETLLVLTGLVVALFETVNPSPIYTIKDSLIQCQPTKKDKLLYSRHLEDSGTMFQVKKRTVNYPENSEGLDIIHCIRAIDNNAEFSDQGGSVHVVKGGLNQTYVVMEIVSKRGEGYNFDISIYGH